MVVEARPEILNHNLETVERMHPWARPGGRYWRSISLLGSAKRMDPSMLTKSGIILGMGETVEEIREAMADLRKARSEEHTSELQSRGHIVCRLLLVKKKKILNTYTIQE